MLDDGSSDGSADISRAFVDSDARFRRVVRTGDGLIAANRPC